MSNSAIEFKAVNFSFGDVPAINALSFSVPSEKVTVLLGPNGAGKTTAMRLITGALSPTDGSVNVLGMEPAAKETGEKVRSLIGIVPAKPALYERSTGEDNLRYAASLYNVPKSQQKKLIFESAERFGIADVLKRKAGEYSTGMKTRLVLARSVLHDPQILLYVEPTSGLDPESSKAVLELIQEMTTDGKTVLMCTHLLVEAENLSEQIVIMHGGTVSASGTKQQLISRYFENLTVHVETSGLADLSDLSDFIARCEKENISHVSTERAEEGFVVSFSVDNKASVPKIVKFSVEESVPVLNVRSHLPTLEDVYFAASKDTFTNEPSLSKKVFTEKITSFRKDESNNEDESKQYRNSEVR